MRFESPGPVTTTTTVLATIDMPEFRGVNMSGIDEFDSIVSDRIVDEIGFKDLGNLGIIDREKPRELLHRPVDFKDDGEEPMNTDENKELWRQGKEFVAEENTQITVQALVHRADDVEGPPGLKTLVEKTGPDAALLTPKNSDGVITGEPPHSDSLDFVRAEFRQSEGLETEFNSGSVLTDEVRGRIHLAVEVGSVTLDVFYDSGSTRTFVRSKVGRKILDSTGKEVDRCIDP